MISAGQFIVGFLEARGVDRAYCVPGESFLPVLDAFIDCGIDLITTRHESSAGFMAVADGRVTGRPGICLVSRGPGATNAAIAVHTADQDGVPMILFVGQVARKNLRRGAFQEIDYSAMYGSMARFVVEVSDPARLPEALARAWHAATGPTPGPVIVSLPEDMLEDMIAPVPIPPYRPTRTYPDPHAVAETAKLLASAQRPLIIAGGRLARQGGREALRAIAEAYSVPVIVSFRRHDLFPNEHPLYAGDLGVSNTTEQLEAYAQSDLVVAVGTRLGDLTTHGYTFPEIPWPDRKLVHVYDDPDVIGQWFEADIGAACDPVAFIEALGEVPVPAIGTARDAYAKRLGEIRATIAHCEPKRAEDGVVFGNVIADLAGRLEDDGIIVPDAGISAAMVYRYFPFGAGQQLLATVTGVMGFGVPGGIAIALRHPGRRVVCLVGDGGFMMTGNELAIAVERNLPLVIVLSNNRSLGTIRVNQEREFPERPVATDLSGPDFDMLARAFGCRSIVVSSEDEIAPALDEAFAHTAGPVLVEVRTSLAAILPAKATAKAMEPSA